MKAAEALSAQADQVKTEYEQALKKASAAAAETIGKQFAMPSLPRGLVDSSDLRAAGLLLDSLGRKTFAKYAYCFCTIR